MKYFRVHTEDIAYLTKKPRGIFTAIWKLVDAKILTEEETAEYWKNREYFERALPVPPFYADGNSEGAITWFKDSEAGRGILAQMGFYFSMAEKYGVKLVRTESDVVPGKIIYEDDFQIAVVDERKTEPEAKMIWKNITIENLPLLQNAAFACDCMDNNFGAANSVLYAKKLGMEICVCDGWIFRRFFEGKKLRLLFPCSNPNENQTSQIKDAILSLAENARKTGQVVSFVSLTKNQKETLESIFPEMQFFPTSERSDYIYLSENLSKLKGKKLGRKRNHIHQFERKYPDYKIEKLNANNLNDAMAVEEKWLFENVQNSLAASDLKIEKEIIKFALDNFSFFAEHARMTGAILYVQNIPAAFCISSRLSENVTDVHFEKCIEPFAKDGGYAVINQEFAKTVETKFINREEDLGLEPLRKAKLSYYPEIVLEKWRGEF